MTELQSIGLAGREYISRTCAPQPIHVLTSACPSDAQAVVGAGALPAKAKSVDVGGNYRDMSIINAITMAITIALIIVSHQDGNHDCRFC